MTSVLRVRPVAGGFGVFDGRTLVDVFPEAADAHRLVKQARRDQRGERSLRRRAPVHKAMTLADFKARFSLNLKADERQALRAVGQVATEAAEGEEGAVADLDAKALGQGRRQAARAGREALDAAAQALTTIAGDATRPADMRAAAKEVLAGIRKTAEVQTGTDKEHRASMTKATTSGTARGLVKFSRAEPGKPESHLFFPLTPLAKAGAPDDERIVIGFASSEDIDGEGEVVDAGGIKNALADFMKWANLREMHGNAAAGTVLSAEQIEGEIEVNGETLRNPLRIVAKVFDDGAWAKVKEGVYKGFSIGGSVIKAIKDFIDGREVNRIVELVLTEISLVDRPANPKAFITVWKRDQTAPIAWHFARSLTGSTAAIGDTIVLADHRLAKVSELDANGDPLLRVGGTAPIPLTDADLILAWSRADGAPLYKAVMNDITDSPETPPNVSDFAKKWIDALAPTDLDAFAKATTNTDRMRLMARIARNEQYPDAMREDARQLAGDYTNDPLPEEAPAPEAAPLAAAARAGVRKVSWSDGGPDTPPSLDGRRSQVLSYLWRGASTPQAIASGTGLDVEVVDAALTRLVNDQLVRRDLLGGKYTLTPSGKKALAANKSIRPRLRKAGAMPPNAARILEILSTDPVTDRKDGPGEIAGVSTSKNYYISGKRLSDDDRNGLMWLIGNGLAAFVGISSFAITPKGRKAIGQDSPFKGAKTVERKDGRVVYERIGRSQKWQRYVVHDGERLPDGGPQTEAQVLASERIGSGGSSPYDTWTIKARMATMRKADALTFDDLTAFYKWTDDHPIVNDPNFREVVQTLVNSDSARKSKEGKPLVLTVKVLSDDKLEARFQDADGKNVGVPMTLSRFVREAAKAKSARPRVRKSLSPEQAKKVMQENGYNVSFFAGRWHLRPKDGSKGETLTQAEFLERANDMQWYSAGGGKAARGRMRKAVGAYDPATVGSKVVFTNAAEAKRFVQQQGWQRLQRMKDALATLDSGRAGGGAERLCFTRMRDDCLCETLDDSGQVLGQFRLPVNETVALAARPRLRKLSEFWAFVDKWGYVLDDPRYEALADEMNGADSGDTWRQWAAHVAETEGLPAEMRARARELGRDYLTRAARPRTLRKFVVSGITDVVVAVDKSFIAKTPEVQGLIEAARRYFKQNPERNARLEMTAQSSNVMKLQLLGDDGTTLAVADGNIERVRGVNRNVYSSRGYRGATNPKAARGRMRKALYGGNFMAAPNNSPDVQSTGRMETPQFKAGARAGDRINARLPGGFSVTYTLRSKANPFNGGQEFFYGWQAGGEVSRSDEEYRDLTELNRALANTHRILSDEAREEAEAHGRTPAKAARAGVRKSSKDGMMVKKLSLARRPVRKAAGPSIWSLDNARVYLANLEVDVDATASRVVLDAVEKHFKEFETPLEIRASGDGKVMKVDVVNGSDFLVRVSIPRKATERVPAQQKDVKAPTLPGAKKFAKGRRVVKPKPRVAELIKAALPRLRKALDVRQLNEVVSDLQVLRGRAEMEGDIATASILNEIIAVLVSLRTTAPSPAPAAPAPLPDGPAAIADMPLDEEPMTHAEALELVQKVDGYEPESWLDVQLPVMGEVERYKLAKAIVAAGAPAAETGPNYGDVLHAVIQALSALLAGEGDQLATQVNSLYSMQQEGAAPDLEGAEVETAPVVSGVRTPGTEASADEAEDDEEELMSGE